MMRTDVDGIPAFFAPRPGTMAAGLVFRVGQADETLARRGVTHLLGHLAIPSVGMVDNHGKPGPLITEFHTLGLESDVVTFLHAVCKALSELPLNRLDSERGIVKSEDASTPSSVDEYLAGLRYGARGHGLPAYPELGVHSINPDDLTAWAARYFTRGNAALWIAGERIPPSLSLRLPDGERQPISASTPIILTPAYESGPDNRIAFNAVVPRTASAQIFTDLLERELVRFLRHEIGLSYSAKAHYVPRDAESSVVTALVDALHADRDAVLGAFINTVARLRAGTFSAGDIAAAVANSHDELGERVATGDLVSRAASDVLIGYPSSTVDELRAQFEAVTATDVTAIAQQAFNSALLMVPKGCHAEWGGYVQPPQSDAPIAGTIHRSPERSDEHYVIIGPEGVSNVDPGLTVTVRYDDCVALLAYPNGERQLIGSNGSWADPTCCALKPDVTRQLDDAVPATVHVQMPAMTPDEWALRSHNRFAEAEGSRRLADRLRRTAAAVAMVLAALAALFGCLAALVAIMESDLELFAFAALLLGTALALAVGAKFLARPRGEGTPPTSDFAATPDILESSTLSPPDTVDPAEMPLRVKLRRLRYAWRASAPAGLVASAIPGGLFIWIAFEQRAFVVLLMPLILFLAVVLPLVGMLWHSARGVVLAADSDGVWLRHGLGKDACWLRWEVIESICTARLVTQRMLGVKIRDPNAETSNARRYAGIPEAPRIAKPWRWRSLRTIVFVPISYSDPDPDTVLATLRELAAGRASVE